MQIDYERLERAGLTPRESYYVTMIVDGKSIKEVAAQFGLTDRTISEHMIRVRAKLGVKNIAGICVAVGGDLPKDCSFRVITKRQGEIARFLFQAKSEKEIATAMKIRLSTLGRYKQDMKRKLGIDRNEKINVAKLIKALRGVVVVKSEPLPSEELKAERSAITHEAVETVERLEALQAVITSPNFPLQPEFKARAAAERFKALQAVIMSKKFMLLMEFKARSAGRRPPDIKQRDFIYSLLTEQQKGVMGYIVTGHFAKETAHAMNLSAKRVEQILTPIYHRFGVSSAPKLRALWHTAPLPDERTLTRMGFTVKQQEFIRLNFEGFSKGEIADKMRVSVKTVEFHQMRVLANMAETDEDVLTMLDLRWILQGPPDLKLYPEPEV